MSHGYLCMTDILPESSFSTVLEQHSCITQ